MSNPNRYRRVVAPGLPSSPPVYLDAQDHKALVIVQVATWRSWGYAEATTKIALWCITGVCTLSLWNWLAILQDPKARVCLTAMGLGLTYAFTNSLGRPVLEGFFARQLFSTRTKITFAPDSIAFRSRLYRNGVVIWRKWRGENVEPRFDVAQDYDATESGYSPYQMMGLVQRRRQTACLVRLIIAVASSNRLTTTSVLTSMRSVPLLEADQRDAPRIATVLTAASALTSQQREAHTDQGISIDVDPLR